MGDGIQAGQKESVEIEDRTHDKANRPSIHGSIFISAAGSFFKVAGAFRVPSDDCHCTCVGHHTSWLTTLRHSQANLPVLFPWEHRRSSSTTSSGAGVRPQPSRPSQPRVFQRLKISRPSCSIRKQPQNPGRHSTLRPNSRRTASAICAAGLPNPQVRQK